ncbi:MAG: di-heme oxidoredictase family protein [Pseudomonadota bacterium]
MPGRWIGLLLALPLAACGPGDPGAQFVAIELDPLRPGGERLTYLADGFGPEAALVEAAYTSGGPVAGRDVYYRDWLAVEAGGQPALGPSYDAASCAGCHLETALQRGREAVMPMVARSLDAEAIERFGAQVNPKQIGNAPPEARVVIEDTESAFRYPDGATRSLRSRTGWAVAPDGTRHAVGLRAAPLLFGWGLLEAVDATMLGHFDDPGDRDGDGISGTMVRVAERCRGTAAIGRMGWKGSHATLDAQIAAALENDMGVKPENPCGERRRAEIDAAEFERLVAYVRQLGVPDRRPQPEPAMARGQSLFGTTGCSSCHVPALKTTASDTPALADQLIWPYSDLMLHDMGPALADPGNAPDAGEWRTPPLWGVGIAEKQLPQRGFLHDGRARSIEEAILWHGGEAEASRDRFTDLAERDRNALLGYVRSL